MSHLPADVAALVEQREAARGAKDYALADELRARIDAAGFVLRDTPAGPVVEPKPPFERVDPATIPDALAEPPTQDASLHLLYEGFPDDLIRFLDAFDEHHDRARAELVVVDNGSPDGERVEEIAGDRARVLHLDREVGWATARNAGLKVSAGAIVAIADLSIEPLGDIITPLGEALSDPAVAVAGPFGLVSDDLRDWRETPGPDAHAIEGYLLATRRELLIGELIHERFAWYRNADIDLSFQLRARSGGGARVVRVPCRKHTHRSWAALDEQQRAKRSKRNYSVFLERWRDRGDLLG